MRKFFIFFIVIAILIAWVGYANYIGTFNPIILVRMFLCSLTWLGPESCYTP